MKCPYCGEAIQDHAVKCRYCKEFISQGELALPPVTYESLIREFLAGKTDRDYCNTLYVDNPLDVSEACFDDMEFRQRAHRAMDQLRIDLHRYIDEEANPEKAAARAAIGRYIAFTLPFFTPYHENVWIGKGWDAPDPFNNYDWKNVPEGIRQSLVMRVDTQKNFVAEKRAERLALANYSLPNSEVGGLHLQKATKGRIVWWHIAAVVLFIGMIWRALH